VATLTVDLLQVVDNLTQGLLAASIQETGKDAGSEREGAIEIFLCESVVSNFQLARGDTRQVSLIESKGIQVGNMVTTNLVGADQQLDFEMVNDIRGADLGTRHQ